MQTVILAAGEGTRMRPLTDSRPKPMLPVGDRPLLARVLDTAVAAGATRFVIVVGHEPDAIESFFGDSYAGIPIEYAVQEEQRGTADAVAAAADDLTDDPFAVLNGDVLYDEQSLIDLYQHGPAVGAYRVDDPRSYGVLRTAEREEGYNIVRSVVEKPDDPPSDLVNAGAYVFPAAARDWLDVEESERGERELTDVLNRVCEAANVSAVPLSRWLDVGRPWELLEANELVLDDLSRSIAGHVSADAAIEGDVVVEEGATVRAGVTIEGPALIRRGATIGPNAYVRGSTVVGEDAHVGHAVEVKNSVLMEGSTAGHLSYVGDSVLGRDVNFGAGTVVANLRHDDQPVEITVKGERVSTGRRKFGVVVGDRAKTGIDTSLNAGVTLSVDATTEPGETVVRDR